MAKIILKTELWLIELQIKHTAVCDAKTLRDAFSTQDGLKQRLAKLEGVPVNG